MPSAVSADPTARPATFLVGALVALLLATGAVAGPAAAAAGDPTRPSGQVVHGPNCTDGFVRIALAGGAEPHTLTLSYDGIPVGPATAVVAGGQTTLEGSEVDWGTTVQVTVAVTGPAGVEDPLPFGTYTRPAEEDCAAVTPPSDTDPTTTPSPTSPAPTTAVPPTTTPAPTTPPTTPSSTTPSSTTSSSTTSSTPPSTNPSPSTPPATVPPPSPTSGTAVPTATGPVGGTVSSGQVSPGSVVTVRGTGFAPGEQVTVTLGGVGAPLATVAADEQGRVEAVVQIPQDAALGPATVQLLGGESAISTAVDLQVAAVQTADEARRTPWPLMVAGLVLLVVAALLAAAAARRPRRDDWAQPGATG